jgi:DNA transposition AAA+ family ATPase
MLGQSARSRKREIEQCQLTLDDHWLLILLYLDHLESIALDKIIQIIDELPCVDVLVPTMKLLDALKPFVKLAQLVLACRRLR